MTYGLFLSLESAVEERPLLPHFDSKESHEPASPVRDTLYWRACKNGVPPVMERVRNSFVAIDRQMTGLSAQVRLWRAAATECYQQAALSSIPDIKSKMIEIATSYEEMAALAERYYRAYSNAELPFIAGLKRSCQSGPPTPPNGLC
jgi:hypothetical protein